MLSFGFETQGKLAIGHLPDQGHFAGCLTTFPPEKPLQI